MHRLEKSIKDIDRSDGRSVAEAGPKARSKAGSKAVSGADPKARSRAGSEMPHALMKGQNNKYSSEFQVQTCRCARCVSVQPSASSQHEGC